MPVRAVDVARAWTRLQTEALSQSLPGVCSESRLETTRQGLNLYSSLSDRIPRRRDPSCCFSLLGLTENLFEYRYVNVKPFTDRLLDCTPSQHKLGTAAVNPAPSMLSQASVLRKGSLLLSS